MTKLAVSILITAVGAAHAVAADPDVESLLARMRQVYSSTKSARLTVKTSGTRFGDSPITTQLTYARDQKIHAKLTGFSSFSGRARVFVSDGKNVSMDDLSGNVRIGAFDLDAIPIPVNLEAMSLWDWKRQLSTTPGSNMEKSKFKLRKDVSWNGKVWTVLEESAYGQDVFVEYFVDPKSALIYRVKVYDIKREQLRIETVVTKIERNVPVDQTLFKVKSGKRIDF